jgi:hypothetical protein
MAREPKSLPLPDSVTARYLAAILDEIRAHTEILRAVHTGRSVSVSEPDIIRVKEETEKKGKKK